MKQILISLRIKTIKKQNRKILFLKCVDNKYLECKYKHQTFFFFIRCRYKISCTYTISI